ncbi:hypothetical protein KNT80_gp09 [Vibrio phage 1.245.O._10N.261.54.C7]|uniref:Uncharacterized protein n=1 Tax=Vibrio phage 1.245.O._10N.261.54.C7 TaxID=1881236 RepID=A0A2I7RW87_9CAUD|nr:hypothetical protein KNT80_gp09 [Vibrio phage 1.245.O._10N.261.54.C7]AUR97922.1 hypothetical protein NVP1245O_09 [Vibrio phage 1.245.O._10N.261.54.C7]
MSRLTNALKLEGMHHCVYLHKDGTWGTERLKEIDEYICYPKITFWPATETRTHFPTISKAVKCLD